MKLTEKMHQAYYDNLTSRGRKLKRRRKADQKKLKRLNQGRGSRSSREARAQSSDVQDELRKKFNLR